MPVKQGREGVRQEMHKLCPDCKQEKLLAEFNGRVYCQSCQREQNKDYYWRNREARLQWGREYNKTEHRRAYARKYQAARWRRLAEEKATRPRPDRCEICASFGNKRGIVYDHDHVTGKFRGWLCDTCNRALGLLKENPDVLTALADYVRRHQCQ